MRLHSSLLELPFTDFLARYGEDVPFHRIVWFKQNGVIVWWVGLLRFVPAVALHVRCLVLRCCKLVQPARTRELTTSQWQAYMCTSNAMHCLV